MDEVEVDKVDEGARCVKERHLTAQTFVLPDFRGGERGDSMIGELEGGGGESSCRKTMLVAFFFGGAFSGTAESSSSESDSDGFRISSVGGGSKNISDGTQKD